MLYYRFRDSLIHPRQISTHNGKLGKSILYLLFLVLFMSLPMVIYNATTGVVSSSDIVEISETLGYAKLPYYFENNTLMFSGDTETCEVYPASQYSFVFTTAMRSEFAQTSYVSSYLSSVANVQDKLSTINFVFCQDGIYIMLYSRYLHFVNLGDYLKYTPQNMNLEKLRELPTQSMFRDFLRSIKNEYRTILTVGSIIYILIVNLIDLLSKMLIPILFSLLIYRRNGVSFKYIFETTVSCCTAYAVLMFATMGQASFIMILLAELILVIYLMINIAGSIYRRE